MRNRLFGILFWAAATILAGCTTVFLFGPWPVYATDSLFPQNMATHVVKATTVPSSPADIYTKSVRIKSIELIPQSTTSPTCTVQDKSGTPVIAYNAVTLVPNHSYRDERTDTAPLFMNGGITWSCSDTTVKAQLIVKY